MFGGKNSLSMLLFSYFYLYFLEVYTVMSAFSEINLLNKSSTAMFKIAVMSSSKNSTFYVVFQLLLPLLF